MVGQRGLVATVAALTVLVMLGCDTGGGRPNPNPGPDPDPGGDAGALTELQKLLDGIPKESLPRADKDGVIERDQANKWVLQNLVGKPLALTATVSDVYVRPDHDAYYVEVILGKLFKARAEDCFWGHGRPGSVRVAGAEWPVHLRGCVFNGADAATAKRLRDLRGKTVTVRGAFADRQSFAVGLSGVGFQHHDGSEIPSELVVDKVKGPYFSFALEDPTIDEIGAPKK